ncbi:putative TLC domain-containing protein [Seiridium unicorne]|uniref:TLC domain-containing protein n=1 Tax=Seiridium unicorne TaxID=138068 RepID=A0ABR2US06_9PEZI
MRDPFPIAPIPALSKAVQPWADYFSLPTLPLHIHEILIIAAFYEFCHVVVSPLVSTWLFPTQYKSLSRSKRLNWDVHVVSLIQSTTINALALWVMFTDEERWGMDAQERVFGYTGAIAMIQALATGYFLWDFIITVSNMHIFGLGMLAHAISALLVYSFGFRPFINYYSTTFILWELSSPFLNVHWFCDKLGLTGSKIQLYNGIALIFTFFSCRLVWGTYNSVKVFGDIWSAMQNKPSYIPLTADVAQNVTVPVSYESTMRFVTESSSVPMWLGALYLGANMTLNSLNFYWFIKMIQAVQKRFDPSKKEGADEKPVSEGGATTTAADAGAVLKTRPRRRTILDGEDGDQPPPGI